MRQLFAILAYTLAFRLLALAGSLKYMWFRRPATSAFPEFVSIYRQTASNTISMRSEPWNEIPSVMQELAQIQLHSPFLLATERFHSGLFACLAVQPQDQLTMHIIRMLAWYNWLASLAQPNASSPKRYAQLCFAFGNIRATWTTTQQLEAYLNTVCYQPRIYGNGAAAFALFGTLVEPSVKQSAMLLIIAQTFHRFSVKIVLHACSLLKAPFPPWVEPDYGSLLTLAEFGRARLQLCCGQTLIAETNKAAHALTGHIRPATIHYL